MKKLIIIPVIIILVIAGVALYFINNNNDVLLKAYLQENSGNYTLVITGPNTKTPSDAWTMANDESKDAEHYNSIPWNTDKAKKVNKIIIQDEIKPISTGFWFMGFENLEVIEGLDKINTSSLENMAAMFSGCKSIKEIDLSSFNTTKVNNMVNLFYGCENLEKVYVSDKWDATNVEYSDNMFYDCKKLIGPNETEYNEYIVDKTFAQVDDLDNAGYLTLKN